jgi:hypothetical protein
VKRRLVEISLRITITYTTEKVKESPFSSRHEACGEMKQSGWPLLLFREEAAVTVVVNEGNYGRKTIPLQTTSSA